MLECRYIVSNAFPFYFFVNCLKEVQVMSKVISEIVKRMILHFVNSLGKFNVILK